MAIALGGFKAFLGKTGGIPQLDNSGKILEAQLPAITITDTFTVADEEEMLVLDAEKGDIAIRTDVSKTFILVDDDPSELANWTEFQTTAANSATLEGLSLDEVSFYSMPAGSIIMWGGSTAPTGFFLLDGAPISRTIYSRLYKIFGTTFGTGDGSTTFNLPDFRGIFPRGAGTTDRTLGKDAADNFYTATLGAYSQDKFQAWQLGATADSTGARNYFSRVGGRDFWHVGGAQSNYAVMDTITTVQGESNMLKAVSDGTNGTPRTGTETAPANLAVNFIIKF